MDVIVIMCIGVLAGKSFIAMQFKQVESDLAGSVHTVSDFFHGSSAGKPGKLSGRTFYIGNSECDFLFLLPSVDRVLLVYPLTRRFLENKKTGKGRK